MARHEITIVSLLLLLLAMLGSLFINFFLVESPKTSKPSPDHPEPDSAGESAPGQLLPVESITHPFPDPEAGDASESVPGQLQKEDLIPVESPETQDPEPGGSSESVPDQLQKEDFESPGTHHSEPGGGSSSSVSSESESGQQEEDVQLNILVMGRAGTGKLTLINCLFGKEKAASCVSNLPMATCNMYHNSGVSVNIMKWRLPRSSDIEEAVNILGSILDTTDLVLFALRMDDKSFRPTDVHMMQEMSRQHGDGAWTKVSFIFTFANLVRGLDKHQNVIDTPEYRTEQGQLLEEFAREILRNKSISESVIEDMPFLSAGLPSKQQLTGEKEPWTSHLVKCVAYRAGRKEGGALRRAVKGHVKIYKTASNKCNYTHVSET